jgi:hypothetical protein
MQTACSQITDCYPLLAKEGMTTAPVSGKQEDGPRQRGEREYFLHRGEYRNPYEVGSADFNAYERGWMQSLKRNDGNLVQSHAAKHAPTRAPSAAPSTYNAYAELKGRGTPRK